MSSTEDEASKISAGSAADEPHAAPVQATAYHLWRTPSFVVQEEAGGVQRKAENIRWGCDS